MSYKITKASARLRKLSDTKDQQVFLEASDLVLNLDNRPEAAVKIGVDLCSAMARVGRIEAVFFDIDGDYLYFVGSPREVWARIRALPDAERVMS